MKRSTQVLLTLMLPAIAAFGCETAKKPQVSKPSNCSGPAKPGEPPKTEFCESAEAQSKTAQTASNNTNHSTRTGSYMPWFWLWGAGRSFGGNSGVQASPLPRSGPMTSSSPNQSSFSSGSRPAGAPSSVSSGGFGRTGSSFSSGS
jgi:hypothetical protein